MIIPVISIGNEKGICLSKTLIEKYNIKDAVELVLEKNYIMLKPKKTPRKNWKKAFKKMHKNGGDSFLIAGVFDDEKF